MCKLLIEEEMDDIIVGKFLYDPEETNTAYNAVKSTLDKFEQIREYNKSSVEIYATGCSLCIYATQKVDTISPCSMCPFRQKFQIHCLSYPDYAGYIWANSAEEQLVYTERIIIMLENLLSEVESGRL